MAKPKGARMGGKYTVSHTTVVPGAALIADIADACPLVTKISLGFIKGGLRPSKGRRSLKITTDSNSLILAVRDNTSHQELRVYATNLKEASHYIGTQASVLGFSVRHATILHE